jgi:hypothetical protein
MGSLASAAEASRARRLEFDGHIVGAAFASGDRIVAGRWLRSPFGSFADVMWRGADGRRTLLAPDEAVRTFLARHYRFDEVRAQPVRVERTGDGSIEVVADPLHLVLRPDPRSFASRLLALRPHRLRTSTAWIGIEDRVLRPLVGRWFAAGDVRTTGSTIAGTREWYAIHDFLGAEATARIGRDDPGPSAAGPPAGFGFSEFPGRPAIVRVTSIFERAEAG